MRLLNRREFLHDSTALTLALAGATLSADAPRASEPAPPRRPKSANEQLNVAVVGVRGRGRDHVAAFAGRHDCVVATVCDVDDAPEVIAKPLAAAEQAQGRAPKFEKDLRRVLDDAAVDVVSIATPNHWHALAAVWAMQAGKDVYVEKPVSHNVREGRLLVEAARKYGRICQAGMQCRSQAGMRDALAFLHAGGLGRVRLARGLCYKLRPGIGKADGEARVPATVDYDLWCGPAPKTRLLRSRLHYDWHWFWDYGNGDLGNQGVHQLDVARWGLGRGELPRAALSLGGRFGEPDDGETPNTQLCLFDYGDCELIFEVRGLPSRPLLGAMVGNVFHGSEGYLVCPGYQGGVAYSPKGEVLRKFQGDSDHYSNFIQAVRSRRAGDLHADAREGHVSSALCHLGNISYRLGTAQPFRQRTDFADDRDAAEALGRLEEHLKGYGVPLHEAAYRLGRRLTIDPRTESFVNDPAADALLTREYRKPFVFPERV